MDHPKTRAKPPTIQTESTDIPFPGDDAALASTWDGLDDETELTAMAFGRYGSVWEATLLLYLVKKHESHA